MTQRRTRKHRISGFSLLQALLIMFAVWMIFRFFVLAITAGFQG